MNLEFLVVALIISKSVDWILQTKKQAENKTTDTVSLLWHCLTFAGITSIILLVILGASYPYISVLLLLFGSHIIIDKRYIVKKIMMWKGLSRHQVYSKEYGWLQIGIDQRLHELVILVIAMVI
jgi:hypothetical protein